MISELKQKVMSDPSVQDAATLVLGVSAGSAGVADLAGKIDLFATTASTLLVLASFIGVVLSSVNVWHKKKQIKIKTKHDQLELETKTERYRLELEKSRLELENLRKTYKVQKD